VAKDFSLMEDSNRSANASIHDVLGSSVGRSNTSRRSALRGGAGLLAQAFFAPLTSRVGTALAAGAAASLAGCGAMAKTAAGPGAGAALGFVGVPVSATDKLTVPAGYTATALAPWGEPVGLTGNMPAFKTDASNTAAEQAAQMGMHHDGLHFYALTPTAAAAQRGLLVMNHEYVDDGLLHTTGMVPWTAEKVAKSQAAHGISVIEVEQKGNQWQMVRPSVHARRITANTPFAVGGPAAGHAMMKTAADPTGTRVLGTFNNCASGKTPWGTYLSGEENFAGYFVPSDEPTAHEKRWGIRKNAWYRWAEHDTRFDTVRTPNEPNRFGWVVEVDPMDPTSTPIKRTALGRAAHEGAWVAVTKDGRAVVYSGEDARFEYIYRFVSRDKIAPEANGKTVAQANATLLDHGTLYVARFDADGRGRWLPLVQGQGPLTAAAGFADQGEVVIKARQASDALGGTKMDRPEWLAIDSKSGWVYCTLTNNTDRGQPGRPGVDAANPRANNAMGHIIRWKEDGDFDGATFQWNHLLLAGDPANERPEAKGNIKGDPFSSADTVAFDPQGRLWIGTDMSSTAMHKGEAARLGNNTLLACDLATGEVRRFMTGPTGCELTGATWSADGCTLFVNVQHPGESPSERSDPANPSRFSAWPDYQAGSRPRSGTVVIRKLDGGVIGS
jgi:uncharacterized protein